MKSVTRPKRQNRKQIARKSEYQGKFNYYWAKSFDRTALPKLRTYFGNVVKGQPNVYDTPFAKGETTKQLLDAWNDVLVSIATEWPSLYEFEKDLREKVGPLSVMLPLDQRMDDIRAYYEGILLPSQPVTDVATNAVISKWTQARGLRMRSQDNTIELMKKSSNSGSPFFSKRRDVTSQTVPCSIHMDGPSAIQFLTAAGQQWNAPAILGWRGQEGGYSKDDVKQRVVWMFPYAVNIEELRVYQVLIEAAQRFNLVPAWVSMESVDRSVTALFDTKADDDLIVCTDFSKFDQHFNDSLQECAKSILSALFTHDQSFQTWIETTFPVKYMIPLAYNYGKILFGKHGMGSGSGGTNADETLAHQALQFEAAFAAGATLNPNSQCLGDDGMLTYPGITVEDVVESYSRHGLEMNLSKQYASTQDCVYLRRWHHKDYRIEGICVGVYSTFRALGRLRYLERFQNPEYWNEKMVALRQLSIIENIKYHPLRDQFAEFCMKRDKFRLGIDIPGFLENIEKYAQESIEHMPDFLGYTKTLQLGGGKLGIQNWWIVQYLKSKA